MEVLAQPVVLDNGSGVIKAGLAGEEQPKSVFSSIIGRPKHKKAMHSGTTMEGNYFIGPKAELYRGLLRIKYPIEHGIVKDWEGMEKIWNYLYSEELKISPENNPVLLTEPALNTKSQREKSAQIFFETFGVPSLYFGIQAVLSLYSSGTTSGIVLDSGDGVTHCVPVFEGFTAPHAMRRLDLAGRDVTEHLQLLLRKAGHRFTTSAEKEIVRTIKEKTCAVSTRTKETSKEVVYVLPDGQDIRIGAERFAAPEILFNPDIIGMEEGGVHDFLVESIMKTDMELRKDLFSNIYLAGGNTMIKGFGDRLLSEMKNSSPKDAKIKITAPVERKFSAWIGGSILANLSTFNKIAISAQEYEEDPGVFERKLL